jgi:protein phosphatase
VADHTALLLDDDTRTSRSAVVPPPDPPDPPAPREPRPRGARRRAVRGAVLVLLPLLLILGIATAALGWYARSSYFVGAVGNEVVIYKGVPGGVLGWNPTVEERTGLRLEQLTPLDRDRVEGNTARGSLGTAHSYVARLQALTTTTTTTRPPTTTTTRRRTTTTTRAGTTTTSRP